MGAATGCLRLMGCFAGLCATFSAPAHLTQFRPVDPMLIAESLPERHFADADATPGSRLLLLPSLRGWAGHQAAERNFSL